VRRVGRSDNLDNAAVAVVIGGGRGAGWTLGGASGRPSNCYGGSIIPSFAHTV